MCVSRQSIAIRKDLMASARNPSGILILVENLPSPFDRRVWQEATALHGAGYHVSIICPTGMGCEELYEELEGIHVWRYNLPMEADGLKGYLIEYVIALFSTFRLTWKVWRTVGFDVIHACNPPDLFFIVGKVFKLFCGTAFVFDHHDISPELYLAKFGRRDLGYKVTLLLERCTFVCADMVIATNDSYAAIAIGRGGMNPSRVHVVRSGPNLERVKIQPGVVALKCGRPFLVGYLGVIGKQEGLEYLLAAAQEIVIGMGRTDVHFGIVGGGTSLEDMKSLSRELGIDDYVTFTGRVPDDAMLAMLNTADVCVNPDVANEMNDKSTMNKVMEYMALAKPIVQFDLAEGRVSAGEASLYATRNDPHDMAAKIVMLLESPARRREMGQCGRRRIERELAWEYEAPKLLRAYEGLFRARDAARIRQETESTS